MGSTEGTINRRLLYIGGRPTSSRTGTGRKTVEKQAEKPTKPMRKLCTQYAPRANIAKLTNPKHENRQNRGDETERVTEEKPRGNLGEFRDPRRRRGIVLRAIVIEITKLTSTESSPDLGIEIEVGGGKFVVNGHEIPVAE